MNIAVLFNTEFDITCFCGLLMNLITLAGVASEPSEPAISLINVLPILQQILLPHPGEGHTNLIAQIQNSSRR